jgi:hypothetical protein
MLKVFGFVRRHRNLSHDDYRAAHVGHHNSYGRRLPNIRGYLLNVWSNRPISDSLGPLAATITHNEPDNFDASWDGYGQLMFDNLEEYLAARSPSRDRAGPNGLEEDPLVAKVGDDGKYMYTGSPFQFQIDEHVAEPVRRPERKLYKLVQFAKRREDLSPEEFRAYWTGGYAELVNSMPGITGHIINFRTDLDVMTGFFEPDSDAFQTDGIATREKFFANWDGMAELWFDDPEQFIAARQAAERSDKMDALEEKLFSKVWYREVDETVAVNPNRSPKPDFFYR